MSRGAQGYRPPPTTRLVTYIDKIKVHGVATLQIQPCLEYGCDFLLQGESILSSQFILKSQYLFYKWLSLIYNQVYMLYLLFFYVR